MKIFTFLAALIALSFSVWASDADPVKAAEGLYVFRGHGGNISALITEDGIIAVDGGNTPEDVMQVKEYLRTLTDGAITRVIVTHYHSDHIGGLEAYGDVEIISSEKTAGHIKKDAAAQLKNLVEKAYPEYIKSLEDFIAESTDEKAQKEAGEKLTAAKAKLKALSQRRTITPTVTFEREYEFSSGSADLRVFCPGSGHTDGNSMVMIKNKGVLITGDNLFHGYYPYIDLNAGASIAGWINILETAASAKPRIVIPGHGDVTNGGGALTSFAEYLKYLLRETEKMKAAGMTEKEAAEKFDYPGLEWREYIPNNIRAAWNEL